jgi:ABC-type multidrug transport system ATPase subunit
MEVQLRSIGKKFNNEWIFRNVTHLFEPGTITAILGRNGSGKSTLLQIISGHLHPTSGNLIYTHKGKIIPADQIFIHLSLVAPYQELIEDFTLREMLKFHFSFKRYLPGFSLSGTEDLLGFKDLKDKEIRNFSSGMKQRVKLAMALLSDVPLVLLDEPAINLDTTGMDWYRELVLNFAGNRTVIICSNQHPTESGFAQNIIRIEDYKTVDKKTGG